MTNPTNNTQPHSNGKPLTKEDEIGDPLSPNGNFSKSFQDFSQSVSHSYMFYLRKLRGEQDVTDSTKEPSKPPTLLHKCIAEAFGTGMIVLTGVGIVHTAVFTGAQQGIWQVAAVWGFGVTLAILTTASVSGAHLNPAVTIAFSLLRPDEFDTRLAIPYILSQVFGAFICGLINYALFYTVIIEFEDRLHIVRGEESSILSALAFGEYFPHPNFQYDGTQSVGDGSSFSLKNNALNWDKNTITSGGAFAIEAFGTAILMLVILSLTDSRNTTLKNKDLAPYFIGFTVAVLLSLYAPLTQAGYNPARDFGPRLAAVCLGWGEVAIPGPNSGFWIYILGPIFGALVGGSFYDFVLRPPK